MWGGPEHVLINWGCGELKAPLPGTRVLNNPWAVTSCIDKRFFFRLPETFPRPPSTEDPFVALEWLNNGKTICVRHQVEGYDGAGLEIVRPREGGYRPSEFPGERAKLYTQFIESDSEWRVHIFSGDVIVQQQRVKRRDYTGPESPIRVSSNGYGFSIERVPEPVWYAGVCCFAAFELDFAALDIIYNSRTNEAYVLEINSAPEMSPYCVDKYSNYIGEILQYGR